MASDNEYSEFLKTYNTGLNKIAAAKAKHEKNDPEHNELARHIAASALLSLKETSYGQALYSEISLNLTLKSLETKLSNLAQDFLHLESSDAPHTVEHWVDNPAFRLEREHSYYGEMGKILHYFRDRYHYLSKAELDKQREIIIQNSQSISRATEGLLSHIFCELLFTKDQLSCLKSLAASAAKVSTINLHSGSNLESMLTENLTIIRQQYSALVCQLALRLFGYINRHILDELMHLKTANGVREGYEVWQQAYSARLDKKNERLIDTLNENSEASSERLLNRTIQRAYTRAIKKASKEKWPTEALIHLSKKQRQPG